MVPLPQQVAPHGYRRQAIAERFGRAAYTYDDNAAVQMIIAQHTQSPLVLEPRQRILDIGSATGRQTSQLATAVNEVVGVDISQAMVTAATQRYPQLTFVQGDAEALPFPSASFDCVYSSMALQWVASPARALSEINRVLRSGGCAHLAIMVAGSLHELVLARQLAGMAPSVNTLFSAETWRLALADLPLRILSQREKCYRDPHENMRSLLRSITKVGAGLSFTGEKSTPLGRRNLQALEQAFPKDPQGQLSVSYQVLHLILEK